MALAIVLTTCCGAWMFFMVSISWAKNFGGGLLAARGVTVTLKVILCQRLGEYISNLVFCVDREYLDKSLAYMFAKVMIANIYMSVHGRSLGSLASSSAPELSSNTLQYT